MGLCSLDTARQPAVSKLSDLFRMCGGSYHTMKGSSMASEDTPAKREVFEAGLRGNHANSKGREAP